MRRCSAPILQDRDEARDLIAQEPSPAPALQDLLAHIDLPRTGQAVVLGARLGGLARALAHRHPSWLVTALDPSVALLSASLDVIRPAGLSNQLTVLQADPETIPLPPASVHAIFGELPLSHLDTRATLDAWARSCARVLLPSGVLAVRVAANDPAPGVLEQATADWSASYRRLLQAAWRAAFSADAITEALHRAGFAAVTHHPARAPFDGVMRTVVARP